MKEPEMAAIAALIDRVLAGEAEASVRDDVAILCSKFPPYTV